MGNQSCKIDHGEGEKAWWPWAECKVTECDSGYGEEDNECVILSGPCTLSPDVEGAKTYVYDGEGTCVVDTCKRGYILESGSCITPDKFASNGTGSGSGNVNWAAVSEYLSKLQLPPGEGPGTPSGTMTYDSTDPNLMKGAIQEIPAPWDLDKTYDSAAVCRQYAVSKNKNYFVYERENAYFGAKMCGVGNLTAAAANLPTKTVLRPNYTYSGCADSTKKFPNCV